MKLEEQRICDEFERRYVRLDNEHTSIKRRLEQGKQLLGTVGVSLSAHAFAPRLICCIDQLGLFRPERRAEQEYQHAHVAYDPLPPANFHNCQWHSENLAIL